MARKSKFSKPKVKRERKPVVLTPSSQRRVGEVRLSIALKNMLSEFDDARQMTTAELIADRYGKFLKTSDISHVYNGAATFVAERTEGKPTQAITVDDFRKKVEDASDDEMRFMLEHGRFPTETELAHFNAKGKWPKVDE
jgi:hypothetical protein